MNCDSVMRRNVHVVGIHMHHIRKSYTGIDIRQKYVKIVVYMIEKRSWGEQPNITMQLQEAQLPQRGCAELRVVVPEKELGQWHWPDPGRQCTRDPDWPWFFGGVQTSWPKPTPLTCSWHSWSVFRLWPHCCCNWRRFVQIASFGILVLAICHDAVLGLLIEQESGSGLWPVTRPDPAPNPGPNDPLTRDPETRFHLCVIVHDVVPSSDMRCHLWHVSK